MRHRPFRYHREARQGSHALICSFLLLSIFATNAARHPDVLAAEVKKNDHVTIVTPGTVARLCPQPGCGPEQHIIRIPAGTILEVEDTQDYAIGTFKVKWFEVIYQKNRGWISIYDTDKAPRQGAPHEPQN